MKKIFNLLMCLAISGVAIMAISCNDSDPEPVNPPEKPDVPVTVGMTLIAADMQSTRAIDENAIQDVNIYLYGTMNYHFYFPTPESMTFEVLPGTYEIFVITNVHKDMGELTKTALQAYKVSYDTMVADIPMVANTNVQITSLTGNLPVIQVKRCAAKIAYAIDVDTAVAANIKLQSVQFCNIPKSTSLFGTNTASTNKDDFYDGSVIDATDVKSFSGVFYMFENNQGTVESITNQKDKSPANAPACATNMRILAQGADKIIEYIVYLGENNTSDFNVRKNTKHGMDLFIKGENELDNRVRVYEGIYYGTANCYLVKPNMSSCVIDTTPYISNKKHEYTGVKASDAPVAYSASVLWTEGSTLPTVIYSLATNQITVSGIPTGNTLVAIKDNLGQILWSYHIWKPEIDPIQTLTYPKRSRYKPSEIYDPPTYEVMPLALGAMNTATASSTTVMKAKTYGCYYQWGRKDPLARPASISVAGYVKTTPAINWKYQRLTGTGESKLAFAIANPTIQVNYYFNDLDVNKKRLWNEFKTIHDPCPAGYKIPALAISGYFGKIQSATPNIKGSFNGGCDFYYQADGSGKTDFYPAVKPRVDGEMQMQVNDFVTLLSSDMYYPTITSSLLAEISVSSSVVSTGNNYSTNAITTAVRCVRE